MSVKSALIFYNYVKEELTMKKNVLIFASLPALLLTGCAKPTFACSFETFKKFADKAVAKAPEVKSVFIKGINGARYYEFDVIEGDAESVAKLNADELNIYEFTKKYRRVDYFTAEKHDELKYSVGLAFNVINQNQGFTYNLKGYLETYAENIYTITHFTITYQYK